MEDTNVHRIHLLKGITNPQETFAGLQEADRVSGMGLRLVALSIVSAIIGGAASYVASGVLGMTGQLQEQLQQAGLEVSQEAIQSFAMTTGVIGGLLSPVIVMAVAALIFLIFFSDIGYKKLFAVELYLQTITVIGSFVGLLLMLLFQTEYGASVLGLGSFTRLFTDAGFINSFFGGITIFLVWKLFVQINAYRHASSKTMNYIVWTLIILNIIYLLVFGSGYADVPVQ